MGKKKVYRCKICGNVFDVYEGMGPQGTNYYCSSCGKSKFQYHKMHRPLGFFICECGGSFHNIASTVACPKCGSTDTTPTGEEGVWK